MAGAAQEGGKTGGRNSDYYHRAILGIAISVIEDASGIIRVTNGVPRQVGRAFGLHQENAPAICSDDWRGVDKLSSVLARRLTCSETAFRRH
jgi:hypothetical protein